MEYYIAARKYEGLPSIGTSPGHVTFQNNAYDIIPFFFGENKTIYVYIDVTAQKILDGHMSEC